MDGEGDEESVVVETVMGNLQSFLQALGKTPAPRAPALESKMSLAGLCGCPTASSAIGAAIPWMGAWKRTWTGSLSTGPRKSEMGWHMAGGDKL